MYCNIWQNNVDIICKNPPGWKACYYEYDGTVVQLIYVQVNKQHSSWRQMFTNSSKRTTLSVVSVIFVEFLLILLISGSSGPVRAVRFVIFRQTIPYNNSALPNFSSFKLIITIEAFIQRLLWFDNSSFYDNGWLGLRTEVNRPEKRYFKWIIVERGENKNEKC